MIIGCNRSRSVKFFFKIQKVKCWWLWGLQMLLSLLNAWNFNNLQSDCCNVCARVDLSCPHMWSHFLHLWTFEADRNVPFQVDFPSKPSVYFIQNTFQFVRLFFFHSVWRKEKIFSCSLQRIWTIANFSVHPCWAGQRMFVITCETRTGNLSFLALGSWQRGSVIKNTEDNLFLIFLRIKTNKTFEHSSSQLRSLWNANSRFCYNSKLFSLLSCVEHLLLSSPMVGEEEEEEENVVFIAIFWNWTQDLGIRRTFFHASFSVFMVPDQQCKATFL